MNKKKLFIVTTVPMSFIFFKGQIEVLKKDFRITLISSPEKLLFQTAAQNNVRRYPILMKREISLLHDVWSLIKLVLYFFKERPDIVHGNTPKGSFLSMAAAWICRVPTRVYYVHGLRYQGTGGLKRKLLMMMERLACYFATNVIAVSKGVKVALLKDAIVNKKIEMIWNGSINGIDLKFFNPEHPHVKNIRKDLNIDKDDFVYGFVGRLVGDKGVNELVHAFAKLTLLNEKTKLLLVGDYENDLDPLNFETMQLIKTNKNILTVGPQKDVRSYLYIMNLFVLPSYREGFGIVLMEAAAMRVPAISSDITGCNEIIQNDRTGFLIPPKDIDALYEKMKYSIDNQDKILEMASLTREVISSKYEQNKLWERITEKYVKITL